MTRPAPSVEGPRRGAGRGSAAPSVKEQRVSAAPAWRLEPGPPRAPKWFMGDDYEEFLEQQSRLRFITPGLEPVRSAAPEPRPTGVVWSRTWAAEPNGHIDFRPRARPRFTLHLSFGGVEAIRRELGWAAPKGVEVGGYLWSHQPARAGLVCVAHVSPPAEGSRHGPTSVQLGKPENVAAAFPDWLARSQLVCVGCWHTHPITNGIPSRPDREAWALRVKRTGLQWASLIVTRGEDGMGWSDPRYTGWVTSPDCGGGFVCEPVEVAQP